MNKILKLVSVFVLLISFSLFSTNTADAATTKVKATTYKTCKELNKVYKYGVTSKTGTKNKVVSKVTDKKTKKVTTVTKYNASKATVDAAVYKLNNKLDADKDGIVCEK